MRIDLSTNLPLDPLVPAQGLNEKIVARARKELSTTLHEKAYACYLRQECQVAMAKAKLGDLVAASHRELDTQVRRSYPL